MGPSLAMERVPEVGAFGTSKGGTHHLTGVTRFFPVRAGVPEARGGRAHRYGGRRSTCFRHGLACAARRVDAGGHQCSTYYAAWALARRSSARAQATVFDPVACTFVGRPAGSIEF